MDKPFHHITSFKSSEELQSYLEEHNELNLSLMLDKKGSTLLHYAAFNNDLMKLKIYVQHYKAYCHFNMSKKNMQAGQNFKDKLRGWANAPNSQGLIAIHFSALNGNIAMIQFFISIESNVYFESKEQQNILFMCVENQQIKALAFFVENQNYKLDLNHKNYCGENIMHKATKLGYNSLVSYLLTLQIDPNMVDDKGWTPLMYAVENNYKQIVKRMLLRGIDRNIMNKQNQNAYKIAAINQNTQLMKILNQQYSCLQKFLIACNKKIVYRSEKSSYLYCFIFFFLFQILWIPINVLTKHNYMNKQLHYLIWLFQGLFQVIIMILYGFLLKKNKKKCPKNILQLQNPVCYECCITIHRYDYHCFTCDQCIYRYDHHCPWLNNCVGAHNIGKFILFLILLIIGCCWLFFCCVFILFDINKSIIFLNTDLVNDGEQFHIIYIIVFIIAIICFLGLILLLKDQLYNLCTNSTSYERKIKKKITNKLSLLGSSVEVGQSSSDLPNYQLMQQSNNCFSNCWTMLNSQN